MFITNSGIDLTRKKSGDFILKGEGAFIIIDPTNNDYKELELLYGCLRRYDPCNREEELLKYAALNPEGICKVISDNFPEFDSAQNIAARESAMAPEEKAKRGVKDMMRFFTEFDFEPNFRFMNTLAHKLHEINGKDLIDEYIVNYFRLLDSPWAVDVNNKITSKEFDTIKEDLLNIPAPSNVVNQRFKVYYGSAGTGKTTLAQKETNGKCIVCNNTMLPSDLMEDFVFDNGQPSFKPSMVWECMENGEPIVFDEINLLPFDSLRFLQGLLDGKREFVYKGRTVHISDGFQIIGTMNLNIGGMVYGLPEPLVDRAADFKEFKLTPEQLMNALK